MLFKVSNIRFVFCMVLLLLRLPFNYNVRRKKIKGDGEWKLIWESVLLQYYGKSLAQVQDKNLNLKILWKNIIGKSWKSVLKFFFNGFCRKHKSFKTIFMSKSPPFLNNLFHSVWSKESKTNCTLIFYQPESIELPFYTPSTLIFIHARNNFFPWKLY